jgi:hypothetical protein
MAKPSLTKQIAEELGVGDSKQKQLELIKTLKKVAEYPPMSVTVLSTVAGVEVVVASPVPVNVGDVKSILHAAIEDLNKQVWRAEAEQAEQDQLEEIREDMENHSDGLGVA